MIVIVGGGDSNDNDGSDNKGDDNHGNSDGLTIIKIL